MLQYNMVKDNIPEEQNTSLEETIEKQPWIARQSKLVRDAMLYGALATIAVAGGVVGSTVTLMAKQDDLEIANYMKNELPADAAANRRNLLDANQFSNGARSFNYNQRNHTTSVEKLPAETGNYRINIIDITNVGEKHVQRDVDVITKDLNDAFANLGLNVTVLYQSTDLNNPEEILASREADPGLSSDSPLEIIDFYVAELDSFIKSNTIDAPSSDSFKLSSGGNEIDVHEFSLVAETKVSDAIGLHQLPRDPYSQTFQGKLVETPIVDAKVVLGNFRDSDDAAGVTYGRSAIFSTHDRYAFVDTAKGTKQRSHQKLIQIITHELGHLLKLPHTLEPFGMSYSEKGRSIVTKNPKMSFGSESIGQWEQIKQFYVPEESSSTTSSRLLAPRPSPKALEHVANSKKFSFANEHEYDKKAPQKLDMNHRRI